MRTPTPKRPQIHSNSKSSIEHGSDVEDNRETYVSRHRAHNEKRMPTDVPRSNVEYDVTPSRRHRERDYDRANEGRRDKVYDRGNADSVRTESKARENDRIESYEHRRKSDKTREVERTRAHDLERPSDRRRAYASDAEHAEHMGPPRRAASSNLVPGYKIQESEFSDGGRRPAVTTHRRHHTEDGSQSTTTVRRSIGIYP